MGTWRLPGAAEECLHIAESEDGSLEAWSDQLTIPGLISRENGIAPPRKTSEFYGLLAEVEQPNPRVLVVNLTAFQAGGSSGAVVLTLPKIEHKRNSLPQLAPGFPGGWERMPSSSCAVP